MSVGVRVKPKGKTRVDVETKEEPKAVVDQRLGKMLKDWGESDKQTEGYWLNIVAYVAENENSREQVAVTLAQFRPKLTAGSVNSITSTIMTAANPKNRDRLKLALAGKMSAKDLRKPRKEEGADVKTPEEKVEFRLTQGARIAVRDNWEEDSFLELSGNVYRNLLDKHQEKEEEEEEEEEEE